MSKLRTITAERDLLKLIIGRQDDQIQRLSNKLHQLEMDLDELIETIKKGNDPTELINRLKP